MFSRITVNSSCLRSSRSYATGPIKILSALPERPVKKIRIGKARPAIYYKFDTLVELSDGSVIRRRSQFPKDELRMITDQRNNPIWNASKPDISLLDAEAKGKLSKFKSKFAAFEDSGKTDEELETERKKVEQERKVRLETGTAPKKTKKDHDDWLDILESNYTEQKLGGNVAQKVRTKKKKSSDAAVKATKK
ncbi:DEKNAAC105053 [Brettanomyces naardenensis]|uniref:DEKNAAC105053 n=1 Tax=Brettanomyces naardenensis TaxID=13370 RepID=A0A448YS41_BRENA|nr:DEKNAAC105053 [Brettanomyces naardenensis]